MRIIVDVNVSVLRLVLSFGARFVQVPDFNSRNPCLTDFRALFFQAFSLLENFLLFLWFMFHWLGYHSRHCRCRYFFDWHLLHVKLHQAKVVHNVHVTFTRRHTQTANQFVHSIISFISRKLSEKKKWEKKDSVASFLFTLTCVSWKAWHRMCIE